MRINIFDSARPIENIEYDFDNLKKVLKEQKVISLLRNKTLPKMVESIDADNQIGVIQNISVYKGIIRGDLIMNPMDEKEYTKLVEDHLKEDRIHIALQVDGLRQGNKIKVTQVIQVYYLYLKGEK